MLHRLLQFLQHRYTILEADNNFRRSRISRSSRGVHDGQPFGPLGRPTVRRALLRANGAAQFSLAPLQSTLRARADRRRRELLRRVLRAAAGTAVLTPFPATVAAAAVAAAAVVPAEGSS